MHTKYLSSLTDKEREDLKKRLFDFQNGKCFICEELIDLKFEKNALQIDYVESIQEIKDYPNNFVLTHSSCSESKQVSNLLVARALSRFEKIKQKCQEEGRNSVTLLNVLNNYNGNRFDFNLITSVPDKKVNYNFLEVGDGIWYHSVIFIDPIGKQGSFFAKIPVEYLNEDTNINSIEIGNNLHEIVENISKERSQVQLALGRIDTKGDNKKILIFEGQYEVAVQILLGNRKLPVRIFVDPDLDSLRTACYQRW